MTTNPNLVTVDANDYADMIIGAMRYTFDDKNATPTVAKYLLDAVDSMSPRFFSIVARDIVEINKSFSPEYNPADWLELRDKCLAKLSLNGYDCKIVKEDDFNDVHRLVLMKKDYATGIGLGYDYGKPEIDVLITSELELVLIQAVSYALGRNTAMPSTVTSVIAPMIPRLSDNTLNKFVEIVDVYTNLGYDDEVAIWSRFFGEVAKEQMRRKIDRKFKGAYERIFLATTKTV